MKTKLTKLIEQINNDNFLSEQQGEEKVGSIGDVNAAEYGGGIVVKTPYGYTLKYTDGAESYHERGEDPETLPVYRADLGENAEDFLSFNDWINWEDVGRTMDLDPEEVPQIAQSPQGRADLAWSAANYYGWENFDDSPVEVSFQEIEAW